MAFENLVQDALNNELDEKYKYFTNIFPSIKTEDHPTISNVLCNTELYDLYIPILGDELKTHELEYAIINMLGKDIGMNGNRRYMGVVKLLPYLL